MIQEADSDGDGEINYAGECSFIRNTDPSSMLTYVRVQNSSR